MTKSDLERIRANWVVEEVRRTISLATVRCLPFDGLIARLKEVLTDSQASEVILAVMEAPRSHEQDVHLAAAVRELIETAGKAHSKDRDWLDRQIGRILPSLPPELSLPLARELLSDYRKGRRTAGFRALRQIKLNDEMYAFVLRRLGETGDDRFAKTLLSYPLQPELVDPEVLLRAFADDQYWRMRVIEAVLRIECARGVPLARSWPVEFVWAAGRIGDERLLPEISRCLDLSNDKLALLGIVAWAYGKLRAYEDLIALQPLLDELARENQLPW